MKEHFDRRSFMKTIMPACAAAGLTLRSARAQTGEKSKPAELPRHKFDRPTSRPLTYRERMSLAYGAHFIPLAQYLDKEIGRDKTIEYLRGFAIWEAEEGAKFAVKQTGKNDLSIFKNEFNPENRNLTTEVLEDTEKVWSIKITECLWASVWRDAGAAELGLAAVCAGDSPFARFINPKITMDLQGTIMEGKPFCILRYHFIE